MAICTWRSEWGEETKGFGMAPVELIYSIPTPHSYLWSELNVGRPFKSRTDRYPVRTREPSIRASGEQGKRAMMMSCPSSIAGEIHKTEFRNGAHGILNAQI